MDMNTTTKFLTKILSETKINSLNISYKENI